jgi:hypothetical protein
MSANSLTQNMEYFTQLRSLFIAVAGDMVTTGEGKDKDFSTLIYTKVIEYINSDRLNIDFGDDFAIRKQSVSHKFIVEPK